MIDKEYSIEGNDNDLSITINLKKKQDPNVKEPLLTTNSSGLTKERLISEIQDKKSDIRKSIDIAIEEY